MDQSVDLVLLKLSKIVYKLTAGPNCSGKFITLKKLFLAYTVQNEELILKWKRKFTSLKEDKLFIGKYFYIVPELYGIDQLRTLKGDKT